ncbi:MAG TPA: endonuclease/exonuclease/phosphatase family protein, partial [bacterium]|nr:endonuclease/exonuclease/phosphatase family protein [bacterium]
MRPLLLAAFASFAAFAPSVAAVTADGVFDDWTNVPVAAEPEGAMAPGAGDPGASVPRLLRVRAALTPERLGFLLELSHEARFEDLDHVTFHLDTDGDPATGQPIAGLGADLAWTPGESGAVAHVLGLPVQIGPGPLGLRRAPTVSSDRFEVSLSRSAQAAGGPLFGDGEPRVVVAVGPESARRFTAPLVLAPAAEPPPVSAPAVAARRSPDHLRVLTYNVLFDGLFKRTPPFRRALAAIDPDVILFQEIFNHSPEETAALVAEILPGEWHAAGRSGGVIVSRLPVLDSGSVGSPREGLWAKLAPPSSSWPHGPLILNPHPPCCGNESGRDEEIGAALQWLRRARARGDVTPETPVIVAGDMNLVGWSRQLDLLLEGDGAPPDGDGTALTDAFPRHLGSADTYTWRNDDGAFPPGRLDFILY